MRKLIFILSLFISVEAFSQTDTTTSLYIEIPKQFFDKYSGKLKVGPNLFGGIKALNNKYYVSYNALNEFEQQFGEVNIRKTNVVIVRFPRSAFFVHTGTTTAGTTTITQ